MAADDPHFRLRVPSDLQDAIRAAAEANGRSMNAEIVTRLKASFDAQSASMGGQSYNEILKELRVQRAQVDVLKTGINEIQEIMKRGPRRHKPDPEVR